MNYTEAIDFVTKITIAQNLDVIAHLKNPQNDWKSITAVALKHSLAPYLYRIIRNSSQYTTIPERTLEELRSYYLRSSADGLKRSLEFSRFIKFTRDNSIPIIPFKGIYLAKYAYEDEALRPMLDIDILIRSEHLKEVSEYLHDREFFYSSSISDSIGNYPITSNQLSFTHDRFRNIRFDLHYSLFASTSHFNIDNDSVWSRSGEATFAGMETKSLSVEDQLINLCIHAVYKNDFQPLRNILDIALFLKSHEDQIDWNNLMQIADTVGCRNTVQLAFGVVSKFNNSVLPHEILKDIGQDRELSFRLESTIKRVRSERNYSTFRVLYLAETIARRGWRRVFAESIRMLKLSNPAELDEHLGEFNIKIKHPDKFQKLGNAMRLLFRYLLPLLVFTLKRRDYKSYLDYRNWLVSG